MHKDYFGQLLDIGDTVIFTEGTTTQMFLGTIVRVTDKQFVIQSFSLGKGRRQSSRETKKLKIELLSLLNNLISLKKIIQKSSSNQF